MLISMTMAITVLGSTLCKFQARSEEASPSSMAHWGLLAGARHLLRGSTRCHQVCVRCLWLLGLVHRQF